MITPPEKHSVSVAAAIVDDTRRRVLLVKRRDNGAWEPPGGVLEANESVLDGLRREVREETEVEIEAIQLTGVYKNVRLGVLALVFRARASTPPARSTDEAASVRWWEVSDLGGVVEEVMRVRIDHAVVACQGDIPVVSHDGAQIIELSGEHNGGDERCRIEGPRLGGDRSGAETARQQKSQTPDGLARW